MNTRLFAIICVIGSFVAIADGLRLVGTGHQDISGYRHLDTIQYITQIVWCIGILCGLIGLIRLGATGNKPIFRYLAYLPVLGYVIAIIALFLGLGGLEGPDNPLGAPGQILAMAGMLIVGILVIAAKKWFGWRRFAPMLYILTIPIGAILVILTGLDGVFIMLHALATAVLGYAVIVESSEPVAQLSEAVS